MIGLDNSDNTKPNQLTMSKYIPAALGYCLSLLFRPLCLRLDKDRTIFGQPVKLDTNERQLTV